MKKFWKKANRGLILTGIVYIILSIYVIVDYISFQSEKETINQTINNYYSDMYEINTKGNEDPQKHKDEITEIIESYWSNTSPSLDWCTTKSDMLNNVKSLFEEIDEKYVYDISSVDHKISNIKINKAGPGYANVTLSYHATLTGNAGSYTITPSSYRLLDASYHEYDEEVSQVEYEKQNPELDNKEGTLSYSAEATIELHKEDETWKICGIEAYEISSSFALDE